MSAFQVVGIDWATEPKNRALSRITCDEQGCLTLTGVASPLSNEQVIEVCKDRNVAVVAVDIPFGWPTEFRQFVGKWKPGVVEPPPPSESFRYRLTDVVVKTEARKAPLSVSSNLIAVGTRQWIDVCDGHGLEGQIDVLGEPSSTSDPPIIEVYPGGTLTSFLGHCEGLLIDGYKSDKSVRKNLLESVCKWLSLDMSDQNIDGIVGEGKDSDRVDSIIAAITALLYATFVIGMSVGERASSTLTDWIVRCPKTTKEREAAQEEGWIFFPVPNEAAG